VCVCVCVCVKWNDHNIFHLQAFTTDFRIHWAQHPLRPEFLESTYFLYKVLLVWEIQSNLTLMRTLGPGRKLALQYLIYRRLHDQHHHDIHLMALTSCQFIPRLADKFHSMCMVVIASCIYMAMYGICIA